MPPITKNNSSKKLAPKKFSGVEKFIRMHAPDLYKPLLMPIAFAALTLLGMNYLSEIFIVHFIPYTYESKNDQRAFISNKTLSNPDGPTIWHFGGSSLAAALDSDIKLKSKVKGKLSFVNLSSRTQTNIESFAILRKANIKQGDVVIIHTSLARLNRVFLSSGRTCTPNNLLMFYKDFVATHNEFGLSQDDVPISCYFTLFTRQSVINSIFKNLTKGNSYAHGVDRYDQKG